MGVLFGDAGRVGRLYIAVNQPVSGHQAEIIKIDLAIIIQVAGKDVPADALQGKIIVVSCTDGNKSISLRGSPRPTLPPADNTTVGLESKRMAHSCADGDKIVSIRRRRLTILIPAPGDNSPGSLEGKRMIISRADSDEIMATRGRGLAVVIRTPSDNPTVGFERERVLISCANGHKIVSIRRHRLAKMRPIP